MGKLSLPTLHQGVHRQVTKWKRVFTRGSNSEAASEEGAITKAARAANSFIDWKILNPQGGDGEIG